VPVLQRAIVRNVIPSSCSTVAKDYVVLGGYAMYTGKLLQVPTFRRKVGSASSEMFCRIDWQ